LRYQALPDAAPTADPPAQPLPAAASPAAATPSVALSAPSFAPVRRDVEVQAAAFEARQDANATPATTSPTSPELTSAADYTADIDAGARRLAPQSTTAPSSSGSSAHSRSATMLPQAFSKFKSLSKAGGGLAIVLALFLLCMWLLRGNTAKTGGVLPSEAFAVLGRAPLTAQSFAQLLRLGNKLVLVAVAADSAHPLAEVTDPEEVDRIAGLCAKNAPHGPSAEFQQVLEQLSREPARGFLGREASSARRRT
jgi:flagellar biogenesis protein FliO